jgi:hypothetical protein
VLQGGRRGNRGESEVVQLNQRFSCPSLDSICPVLPCVRLSDVVQDVGGRSRMSLHMMSVRDLPHTYSCRTLPVVKTMESKFSLNRCLKCLNFFFELFIYFCTFYHGKLGLMSNLAG